MGFILEQQAQLVVRVQQLGEVQANWAAAMMRQEGIVNQVISVVAQLAAAERNTQLQLQELVAAQRRTDEKLQGVAENLNALIQVIQKLIHRDGRQA